MRRIKTFMELFEATEESKGKWMPSMEEIMRIPEYVKLSKLGIISDSTSGRKSGLTPLQLKHGSREFFCAGSNYSYTITPASIGKVRFKYGSYMMEDNQPFETVEEKNALVNKILIHSLSAGGVSPGYPSLRKNIEDGDIKKFMDKVIKSIDRWSTLKDSDHINKYLVDYLKKCCLVLPQVIVNIGGKKIQSGEKIFKSLFESLRLSERSGNSIYMEYSMKLITILASAYGNSNVNDFIADYIKKHNDSKLIDFLNKTYPDMWKEIKNKLGRGAEEAEKLVDLGF